MKDKLLKLLRNKYKEKINLHEKSNHYFKLGEIAYLNLKDNGIKNFRDNSSGIGLGYDDSVILNARVTSGNIKRSIYWLINFFTFGKFFKEQEILNRRLFEAYQNQVQYVFSRNKNVIKLIKNYNIKNTTLFGCKNKFSLKKKNYSVHYLEICNKIDFINKFCDLSKIKNYCEIGGGFGSNIHLIQQNFKNIKKFLLIDIFPSIYVATRYLQKIYGNSVVSYDKLYKKDIIQFSNDDKLEIICLPNWEIGKFSSKIDHFHNGDSFSHLSIDEIKKYLSFLRKLSIKSFSVNDLDLKNFTTTSPHKYIKLFNKKIKPKYNDYVIDGLIKDKNLYFIGKFKS
tara:strand:+ start:77 stop:1096 length:1020 start_codon:yes stop_codon:yes gene_type:complete